MRKLTYKQAAECGENLKAWVTPEQSKKMQKVWLDKGKTWCNGSSEISVYDENMFMFLTGSLMHCDRNSFIGDTWEQIELIDDLPQHDFSSQQEMWAWLGQGNKVKNLEGRVYGFKDGVMWNFTLGYASNAQFTRPKDYQKHTPPRLIRVNGIEVPEPLESLDGFDVVYIAVPTHPEKYLAVQSKTYSDSQMLEWKNNGLCYATKEDAIKRAEAMILFEVVE